MTQREQRRHYDILIRKVTSRSELLKRARRINEQTLTLVLEAYLHGRLAEVARGGKCHGLTRRQGGDEANWRLGSAGHHGDDQAIAVWHYGVVGDTVKCAEIDTLALDGFYRVGANAVCEQ